MSWTYPVRIDAIWKPNERSPFFDEHRQRLGIERARFSPKIVTVAYPALDAACRKFEIKFYCDVTNTSAIAMVSNLRNMKVDQLLVSAIRNLCLNRPLIKSAPSDSLVP